MTGQTDVLSNSGNTITHYRCTGTKSLGRKWDNMSREENPSLQLKLSKKTRTKPLRRIRDNTRAAECKKSVA